MEVRDYLKLKKELEDNIGKNKLENITNGITKRVKENNLDCTPNVMLDVFKYVRWNVLTSKIWIYR